MKSKLASHGRLHKFLFLIQSALYLRHAIASIIPSNEKLQSEQTFVSNALTVGHQDSKLPSIFDRQLSPYYFYDDSNATFIYDLSEFSIQFEKCQLVQMFNDDLASENNAESPLGTMHFVVFRLCQSESCSQTSKGAKVCGDVYGLYTLDLKTYLEATVEYQKEEFEIMCNNCEEECTIIDESTNELSCTGCGKICYQYNNLETMGYIDAAEFVECQQVQNGQQQNENEEEVAPIYIGPRCSKSGTQIKIGLFSDENCLVPLNDMNITEVLGGAMLSYHLLANTYSTSDSYCLSCKEQQNDENNGDQNNYHQSDQWDVDNVNEMCENLYNGAAKCESETGLTNGFIQTARNDEAEDKQYENQVENEFMACTFIQSLIWNSYTQTGEINFYQQQDVIIRELTKKQTIYLSSLSAAMLLLVGIMYYYQRKIREISPRSTGKKGEEESAFI